MLSHKSIYVLVALVPSGRVATYGQVARLLGHPRGARQVGYALARAPDDRALPWHRVVNARGVISARRKPGYEEFQRLLLEDEGVEFDARGRIPLARFQWRHEMLDSHPHVPRGGGETL